MKKSLLALAVFGAFSGAAFAQSNVQLYGIIDLGVTHFTGLKPASGTGTVSSTGLSSGVDNGSRIGVKGTEDLGGGLKAFFTAETGFCAAGLNQNAPTTQAGPYQTFCTGSGFMQRQAFAGLAGNFGTLTLGRQYTLAFNNEANVDPFGYGLTGSISNLSLTGQGGAGLLSPYYLARANQAVTYATPNLSGFTGAVAYSFAPGASGTVPAATGANSNVPRSMALNGQYANGPVMAGLNYTRVTNVYANPTGVSDGAFKMWQLYGSYDFGIAKLSGIYEKANADYTSGSDKYWMLGATFPVGPGAILASYGQNKNDVTSAANPLAAGTAKQYAIGYTYSLSKRTNLYTSYAHISNDAASASLTGTAYTAGTTTDNFAGVLGQGSSGFALGIRHQF